MQEASRFNVDAFTTSPRSCVHFSVPEVMVADAVVNLNSYTTTAVKR